MAKPFGGLEEFMEQEDAKREASYAARLLRAVLRRLYTDDAQTLEREAGDEFGFRWFNDSVSRYISIDATKNTVSLPNLLRTKGITKTELWKTYFDLRGEYGSPFALLFPIPGLGQWAIHDNAELALLPGYTHIIRRSEQRNARLTIQPLEAFLSALAGT
jgi:hypothetical protein